MRLTIARPLFLKLLNQMANVIERKHAVPILSNVLLEVLPEQIRVTGTDLGVEIVAQAQLPAGAVEEPGRITLPARNLIDIVKSLPAQATIKLYDDAKGLCHLHAGSARIKLETLPADDFPSLGEQREHSKQVAVSQGSLKRLIDKTAFAMAVQDVRFYLTGMLFEIGDHQLRTVTTDGHRLAKAETSAELAGIDNLQAIVPRKGVLELQRLLSPVDEPLTVVLERDLLSVKLILAEEDAKTDEPASIINLQLVTKLIEGKFPDYRRVIPVNGTKVVKIERLVLQQALRRVVILSNEKQRGVLLKFSPNVLNIQSLNQNHASEAIETIAIDYQGEALDMSFNHTYLNDILNTLEGEIMQLTLSDANAPALVQEPEVSDYVYVVMPMRL